MSKSSENTQTTTTKTANTKPAAAPAETSAADIAAQVIGLIDQIEALVPGFLPHDRNDAKRVASAARFARDLVPPTITAVTSFTPAAGVFDAESGKAALTFGEVMQPVAQRLSALLDGVEFTIDSRLAEAGTRALSAYAWAKRHAKGPEGVALRPYLDHMERTVKKTLNRRKPTASPAAPPTPAPHGAQGFLAPNLAQINPAVDDDDLPEDFRNALHDATKE
jgi:hypothetical protein